jgi:transcriptional regulator with XRE-family HTH domain
VTDTDGERPEGSVAADSLREGAAVSEEIVAVAGAAVTAAVHDLGGFIRAQRESTHVSLRQLAKRAGVSNPYLSQIERGLRKPSAEVLQQIAKGLRVSAEALYVQAGILERKEASPVLDAVLNDIQITERQKQVLIEIYESFRRENTVHEPTVAS